VPETPVVVNAPAHSGWSVVTSAVHKEALRQADHTVVLLPRHRVCGVGCGVRIGEDNVSDDTHVVPNDDLHKAESTCWCQPVIDYESPFGERVYVHRRTLDGPVYERPPDFAATGALAELYLRHRRG
jgi:hypothetical protein